MLDSIQDVCFVDRTETSDRERPRDVISRTTDSILPPLRRIALGRTNLRKAVLCRPGVFRMTSLVREPADRLGDSFVTKVSLVAESVVTVRVEPGSATAAVATLSSTPATEATKTADNTAAIVRNVVTFINDSGCGG
jgi:hypothetical protein